MNGAPFPYMNNPFNQMNPYQMGQTLPLEQELIKLKKDIEKLNKRVYALENKDKKDYLQKDDGLYIM